MDWFLYDNGLRHERVKPYNLHHIFRDYFFYDSDGRFFTATIIFVKIVELSLLCPKFFFFVFFKQEIISDKSDIFTYNISLLIFTTVHYESNLTTKLHLVGSKRCLTLTHFSPMSHFYTPWKHRFRVV